MRIKAKNALLGLHVENLSVSEQLARDLGVNRGDDSLPLSPLSRLVSAAASADEPAGMPPPPPIPPPPTAPPPVPAASNASSNPQQVEGQADATQAVQEELDPLQQLAILLQQDVEAASQPAAVQPAKPQRPPPPPPPPPEPEVVFNSAGRPVRKRKGTQQVDFIPVDVLQRRSRSKPAPRKPVPRAPPPAARAAPPAAGNAAPMRPPPPQPRMQPRMPVISASLQAAAAAAAPAAAAGTAMQLVTVPKPGGGTMTGLAIPAAALLAMQQQLLRAQGAAAGSAAAQPIARRHTGPMPYRLLPVVQPPAGSAQAAPPPAVRTAGPRDIVHLAKQLDDEEIKKALAASDTRVPRVQPGKGSAGQLARSGSMVGVRQSARARQARQNRQPNKRTPEPAERRLQLPPGTWHPGFEAVGGVTHVDVVAAAAAPRLPAVVVGTPPRFSQPLVHESQMELDNGEDPLAASLDFLRSAARTAGRIPYYDATAQAAVAARERVYRERLGRAHFGRDGRSIIEDPLPTVRKSVRVKQAAVAVKPPPPPPPARPAPRPLRVPPKPKPGDDSDVRRGFAYQAKLPAVRPRPAQPTEEEAKWVSGLACKAGDIQPSTYDKQQAQALAGASQEERAAQVSAAHSQLCAAVGQERCGALGLLAMGADECGSLLSEEEEAGLEAGMREMGRNFHAICLTHVPTKTPHQLQSHYYNVWKLRATPRSRAWYDAKAAEAAERKAAAEMEEQAAQAELESVKQRQENRLKRRMLREVVLWLKGAAREHIEIPHRSVVVHRAQRLTKYIGGLDAEKK